MARELAPDIGVTGFSIRGVDALRVRRETALGVWRSGRRRPPGHGPRPGPPGRGLATRGAPAHLWRCARLRRARHRDGGRAVPPGLHRSALQRADRRACTAAWAAPRTASSPWFRLGDQSRGVHRISAAGPRAAGRCTVSRDRSVMVCMDCQRHLAKIIAAGEAVFTSTARTSPSGSRTTVAWARSIDCTNELILVMQARYCSAFCDINRYLRTGPSRPLPL